MKRQILKIVLLSGLALMVISIIAYWLVPKPELVTFTTYSKAYIDNENRLLRISLAEDQRYRLYTTLDDISTKLIDSTVLYEDKNFFEHGGVNFPAILRAFWSTYISGGRRIGASTITMQVARLRWQVPSNTVSGKIHQIFRAIQLTRHYSKQDILESYLNMAPYGRNIEGIGAASLIYFNKTPAKLSLPEALTLAVIPQNPNKRTPTTKSGFNELVSARLSLFNRWSELHPKDMNQGKYLDLPLKVRAPEQLPFLAPHFVDYINTQKSRWDSGYVKTTLDRYKQLQLEKIVAGYIATKSNIGVKNASALLLNYKTMKIESMVGSADFFNKAIAGQVNGTLAKRSPGSTLKPFVYGLAMDEGKIHPMSLMKDSPVRFGGFTPENYDKQFLGPILARDALIQSRNVPAVELQAQLSKLSFYGFLKKAGISDLKDESFYGLALALGGGELTMLEITELYAMLANQGQFKKATGLVKTITNEQIELELLSPEASYLVLDILKDNPAPDAFDEQFKDNFTQHESNEVAWKTGTSWAFRDAWAIGISGDYVLAVWVGNFNGQGNSAFIGRSAAGPLMFSIFDAVIPNKHWSVEDELWSVDLNIKQVAMCRNTGDLPGRYCINTEDSLFIPGVSPIKVSTVYRAIPILKTSGKRACWYDPKLAELKTYEFWRSDFLQVFKQAGISLRTPPPYESNCTLDQKSTVGTEPLINSPQSSIDYVIQPDSSTTEIPLMATVEPDVKKLFWFIDEQFIAEAKPSKPFFWQATTGRHRVRVVDDSGRSASKNFNVLSLQ
jgi:penicillin-binding protein 1C